MMRQTSELITKGPCTEAGEIVGVRGGFAALLESLCRRHLEGSSMTLLP